MKKDYDRLEEFRRWSSSLLPGVLLRHRFAGDEQPLVVIVSDHPRCLFIDIRLDERVGGASIKHLNRTAAGIFINLLASRLTKPEEPYDGRRRRRHERTH